MSVETCWRLSQLWYADRMQVDWQAKSAATIKRIFDSVGLIEDFWSLDS